MAYRTPDLMPTLRYADAKAAIDWLERAFGFERHAVYENDEGRVEHAELRFGSNGMVMLGSVRETPFPVRTPAEAGGVTSMVYLIVDDADVAHDRAVAAGAEIIRGLTDQDYGSREFSVRDPEGYVWNFGTYRPPVSDSAPTAGAARSA
jgi:uncharacterized glyoxalase superfamily protein PhnB